MSRKGGLMPEAIGDCRFLRWISAWGVVGLLCFSFTGCAAPKRTFMPESKRMPRKSAAPEVAPQTNREEPTAEAKPSVWSKWMGSLTPGNSGQTPAKPAERIPLPRTDGEAANSEAAAEASPF